MNSVQHETVLPDPKRMIEGLRDTGYEFETSMADVIDNSIAAEATMVNVKIELDFRGKIRIAIADNGIGMSREKLIQAMKYGSEERENPESLGKFGLGMKTASTAFCRKLSVVSKDSGTAEAKMATWDLDHVGATNRWDLLVSDEPDSEAIDHLNSIAPDHSGTVVIWEKIDRLMKAYDNPTGAHARRALESKVLDLREHLALVYQRFLDPSDSRARNLKIVVNDAEVVAWDPFMKDYSDLVAEQTVEVQTPSGKNTKFVVRAYILPRSEEFPSADLAKLAKTSPNRQGIYIYRENRLLVAATWLRLFKIETHFQLLRVEFSFNHELDEAFHLDIKKSQVILNDDLLKWLGDEFLRAPRREANNRSRKGAQKEISEKSKVAHENSNNNIRNRQLSAGGATIIDSDPELGQATIENSHGRIVLKIPVEDSLRSGEVFVQPVEGITDGLLFEPAIIEKNRAVKINTAHPYYHKVYVPNLNESVTIQGMDALMWALSVAELTTVSDKTAEGFKDLRYEVSRILKKLVETLPDPTE
jgi:hypothetical protein